MENPQPDTSDAWQYTRYGFLFAWCVEQDAFSESPDSIEFMESVELIKKNIIPTRSFSNQNFTFTASCLKSKYCKFFAEYFWYTRGFDFDFGNSFISKTDIPDLLVSPSWNNYLKLKKIIDLRFDVWINKSQ